MIYFNFSILALFHCIYTHQHINFTFALNKDNYEKLIVSTFYLTKINLGCSPNKFLYREIIEKFKAGDDDEDDDDDDVCV